VVDRGVYMGSKNHIHGLHTQSGNLELELHYVTTII